ncbi:MFS transporter [Luteimicrobium subarcticum]|uniref:DHA1 family inner membrane transport protein n=1 Tax=Luteimicrobium subarcticum TaxID=620910 RepID=A0A2M8WQW8_9MICO|nr:MFS transporter [Luteimicrobium subarcticum]PJI93330.1 DHA1 family inner membrane transport protein [Luteimicrobium subarcticum]
MSRPPSTPAGRSANLALLALALGGFTIGTTEFASMGLLPDIADDLGASIPAAGHAITAYAAGVVVGAPLLTVLAARLPRRTLLLALMGFYAVANVLSALAPSLPWLLAGRFLAGLPHGAFFGVGAVVGTAVVGPARRGRAVATMMVGLTVANVVGVPLATFLGQRLGWRDAYVAVGLLGAVAVVGLWCFVPRGVAAAEGASVRRELGALRNGPLWTTFVAAGIGFGGLFAVYTYVAPLVTDVAGLGDDTVPVVLALFGVGMTVGTLLAGRLVDRSVLRTVILGFAATAASLVVLGLTARTVAGVLVGLFLLAVTSSLVGIAMQTRLMDLSPAAPSLGAALSHSALNLGNADGAWVGGLTIAAGWGYVSPTWAGVGLTLAGLAIVVAFGRQRVPRHDDDASVTGSSEIGAAPVSQRHAVACAASAPSEG